MRPPPAVLDESVIAGLRSAVTGDVIAGADAAYDEARSLWNGAIDRYPAVIVRPTSTGDVATAIGTACDEDLPLSVRGGGHHVTGSALVDDGLSIDLSRMDGVTIDPETRTAQVGPGARVADVLGPAQEHGLSPIVGSAAENGVAGSTLAGGIGWLRREFGLGVDHLRSVELVTVDGAVLTVNESEHPDLFWAIRGGGPNMGVVTRFELELVEVGPEVAVVQAAYPVESAPDVLAAYREYAAGAPDEVTTLAALLRPPSPMVPPPVADTPVAIVTGVYAGPVEEGDAAMAPLRELAEPVFEASGVRTFASVHDLPRFHDGRRYSWHSLYATELDDDIIETLVEGFLEAPSSGDELVVWQLGGAITEVPVDATAFGFRDTAFLLSVDAAWDEPGGDERNVSWAREIWEALRERDATAEGFYPGFPGFVRGEERARMAYGRNYDRLVSLKTEWDPENIFRHNLNVEPDG